MPNMKLEFSLPPLPAQATRPNHLYQGDEPLQYILPRACHSTCGLVSNAQNLLSSDTKLFTTLTRELAEETAVLLDFGVAVAGIPVIYVEEIESTRTSNCVIDFRVSEGLPGILRPDGDGPFPFSAGADTSRRVRFRLNGRGFYQAQCVQGSQRWARLSVLSGGPCTIRISLAGFIPTTSNTPVDRLPGLFQCSDKMLSQAWACGARTLQLNSIPARTIPPPWQVSADMGVLIDSQRCNAYGWGGGWTDYTVEFCGMILEGGLAWNVRVFGNRPGMLFQLSLDGSGVARLEQWYGYYNTAQTTLEPKLIASTELKNAKIEIGQWFKLHTVCEGDDVVRITINEEERVEFKQGRIGAEWSPQSTVPDNDFPHLPRGSVGIGAGMDQVCRFKDMVVRAIPSGEVLYQSALNTSAVLSDFGIGWNQLPYLFDGAKRDRYPWTADIIIGGKALYYSTAGTEYVRGNILASILRENDSPLLAGGGPPGLDFGRSRRDTMFTVLTINYSLYLILVVFDYWWYTGDGSLLELAWPRITRCLSYMETKVDDRGLLDVTGVEAGDYDYYNGIQAGISTKRNALYVAVLRACAEMTTCPVLKAGETGNDYLQQAQRTATAIKAHCYNPKTGHFNIADSRLEGFQQETHAWLVTEGLVTGDRLPAILAKLAQLGTSTHNAAPLSFSQDTPHVPPVISPIMSAFHIMAAITAGQHAEAEAVLRRVWEPMMNETSEHFTGTTWEFLTAEGAPFKGDFCSYAQLFSVGPTFILPRYVLGVEPRAAGFRKFVVYPRLRIDGLLWAQGRVSTPKGEHIEVRWQAFEAGWRLSCRAPVGLTGSVVVPDWVWSKRKEVRVNGTRHEGAEEIQIGPDGVDVLVHFV
ncbi:Six-hairpin glycosidase [Coniochaeta ligniaria NRRL 30616]|uniref:Six-hairpin glycosidase n=1 Tax=Coniochaeta ligniaria NRRL 30616 TaxID=1408157 RepID=A0A1J7IVE3_9PEZI|nr:Six-hairpin glycosidase [Coniochaeta ligniaria NRRL 30616]